MKCTLKKLVVPSLALGSLLLSAPVDATINADVNIVYPLQGSTVTNYFNSSFSTTCPGGANKVEWYFDGVLTGSAEFYDQFSAQFQNKLPSGNHSLKVVSSCGGDGVTFDVL